MEQCFRAISGHISYDTKLPTVLKLAAQLGNLIGITVSQIFFPF
jgi:hypothetical protein